MSTAIVGASPNDLVVSGELFRAVWEGSLSSWMQNLVDISGILYTALRNGSLPYLTPAADPGTLDGDKVIMIDVQTFAPDAPVTVAQMANDLNGLAFSASLRSLTRVQSSDVFGDSAAASRDATKAAETIAATDESFLAKLGQDAKYVAFAALALVVVALILAARKVVKEV